MKANYPNTITACNAIEYSNIIAEVCHKAGLSNTAYKQIFFEVGCQLVEEVYSTSPHLQKCILQNVEYNYWNWFHIEYIHNDAVLKAFRINNQNYYHQKLLWISTFGITDALTKYYTHKKILD